MQSTAHSLLAADEPAPFERIDGRRDLILVCDHASARIPRALGRLGLPETRLGEHIAWDIGAAAVTHLLQRRLGATAVLAAYSRLVVDLNRGLGDRSVIPAISDGVLIPGNLGLDEAERLRRVRALHAPYHAAVEAVIGPRTAGADTPIVLAIHSFTPRVHGTERPWHLGVLWDSDPRLALPLLSRLRRSPGVVVGDNEPYSGRHTADYTLDRHAEAHGIAHAGIEVRQDLVGDESGQARIAGLLGDAVEAILADPALRRPLAPVDPIA